MITQISHTYMKSASDLLIENNDEPIEAREQKQNDDEAVSHNLVTGLDCFIVLF